MSAAPTRLVADRLEMRYGRRRLFENLSITVEAGAPLAVTGANGAGKSTLLLLLAGLVSPVAGTVSLTVDGWAVADATAVLKPLVALARQATAGQRLYLLAET